jgi:type II secretory pathway pseudopilin PulG
MRRRGLRSAKLQITNHKSQIPQRGYMLITLMLALALITIGLLTVLPEIGQQIRRDREDEMRHRGTAYMRAIQHFYKKFGRYPSRPEELENTNNLRFIRKLYKDPINRDRATGKEKDFKLLHQQDISLNNGPVLGQTPGQSSLPGQGGAQGQGGFGGAQGGFGGLQGGLGGLGAQPGGLQPAGNSGAQTPPSGDSGNTSSGNSSSGNSSDAGGNSNSPGSSSNSNSGSNSGSGFNGPTFGGGPFLGVASASKEKSIRVFYEKNHYNDWLFIYVPAADRGGLLTGPVNPGMPAGNLNGVTPGQTVSGQGQGLMPGSSQTQVQPTQPAQNPGQTPPQN